MKTTIAMIGAALLAAVGTSVVLDKQTSAQQQLVNSGTQAACPVPVYVPPSKEESDKYFNTLGEQGVEYTHCKVCNAGVLLTSKEGVVRCTYCGKE